MPFSLADHPKLLWKPTVEQFEAIERLPSNKGFLIADVTGMGKTYAAICAFSVLAQHNENAHLLVLSTKSSVASWRHDLSQGTVLDFVEFLTTTPELDQMTLIGHRVTVMTYSSISKYPNYLQQLIEGKYVVAVADEFHRAADPEAMVGKIVRYLRQFVPYFWGLTATPIGNKLESLYNLVDLLRPGYLGHNWPAFLRLYTVYRKRRVSRSREVVEIISMKNTELLGEKLRAVMIRRDINVEVKFHRVTVDLTAEEEKSYLIAAAGEMGLGKESLKQFSARLPDLQLVVNNAADSAKEYNDDYTSLGTKETQLLDLLGPILHRGEPVCKKASFR